MRDFEWNLSNGTRVMILLLSRIDIYELRLIFYNLGSSSWLNGSIDSILFEESLRMSNFPKFDYFDGCDRIILGIIISL